MDQRVWVSVVVVPWAPVKQGGAGGGGCVMAAQQILTVHTLLIWIQVKQGKGIGTPKCQQSLQVGEFALHWLEWVFQPLLKQRQESLTSFPNVLMQHKMWTCLVGHRTSFFFPTCVNGDCWMQVHCTFCHYWKRFWLFCMSLAFVSRTEMWA